MRDWRISADFAHARIRITRRLYVEEGFAVDLDNTAYALDASLHSNCGGSNTTTPPLIVAIFHAHLPLPGKR